MMGSVSQPPHPDKGNELRDLMQRFMAALAEFSQRLPFDVDFQKLRSVTALATLAISLIFAWKLLRTTPQQRIRHRRRPSTSPNFSTINLHPDTSIQSSEIRSYSGVSREQRSVNEFFQPLELSLEQLVRHRWNECRKVTCQLLGVVLDETTPEELQIHATVRPFVLEVLLQITKSYDVYLMERILDDESGERVLSALEDSGVFTSGGLVREKVLFCSTENGRMSFVRQLEPDWHFDSNAEIVHQLTVCLNQLLMKLCEMTGLVNAVHSRPLRFCDVFPCFISIFKIKPLCNVQVYLNQLLLKLCEMNGL